MALISLHDRAAIERALLRHPEILAYELGDLDDFFWPRTVWYALAEAGEEPEVMALLYLARQEPTLLLLEPDVARAQPLLSALIPALPTRFYAHLTCGLEESLRQSARWRLSPHGLHLKMALRKPEQLSSSTAQGVVTLNREHLGAIERLYAESYPGNWFDPRMLETGHYVGVWGEGQQLISIAGVHVFSRAYGIAALGNITTHPSRRNEGLGSRVTAGLCQRLLASRVTRICLNVKADNEAAIACYQGLGFATVSSFGEFAVEATGAHA